jgi:hypothetical protein
MDYLTKNLRLGTTIHGQRMCKWCRAKEKQNLPGGQDLPGKLLAGEQVQAKIKAPLS